MNSHIDQIFEYVWEGPGEPTRWLFHVPRAWELIRWLKEDKGVDVKPRQVNPQELENICEVNCHIDPTKLRGADETIPGISVLLEHPGADFNPFAVLIDGSHRAHRARQLKTQFSSYLLPKELWAFALLTAKEVELWLRATVPTERVVEGELKTVTQEEMVEQINGGDV